MRAPFLFLLLLSPGAVRAVDSAIPVPFPAGRYEKLVESAPFALATPQAAVAPVENTAGFAEGWYVSGLARMDGKDFVTIKSRDQSIQFSLFGTEENRERAVVLDHVDWSPDVGKSKVTIRKGDELANLEFNQADMQTPTAPVTQSAAPAMLRSPGAQPSIPRPGNMPSPVGIRPPMANQPGIRPRTAPGTATVSAIPLPGTQPNATQANPVVGSAGASPNNANRRRIRVINSGQPNQ